MFTLNNIYEEVRIQTIKNAYKAKIFLEKFSNDSEYKTNLYMLSEYVKATERELEYIRRKIKNDLQTNTATK